MQLNWTPQFQSAGNENDDVTGFCLLVVENDKIKTKKQMKKHFQSLSLSLSRKYGVLAH